MTIQPTLTDEASTGTVEATRILAEFAAGLTYDDLPARVRHQAKRIIVDTLACIVGAGPYEGSQITDRVIRSLGGTPEAHAIPSGVRTSAPNAAYVNAELANALDLDDNLLNHTHFANTAVAAPLAMAERLGSSGRDLIVAVVAAYEVSARLTLSFPNVVEVTGQWPDVVENFRDLHGMGFSIFGAAAGCGNLAGLEVDRMRHAFGTAGYHAPVPSVSKGSLNAHLAMKKYAAYGQIAWASIVSVLLAAEGYTADDTVLDGPRGFWRMTGAEDCDWGVLTGGLGAHWWSLETSFKLVPICTWNRHPLRPLREILDREGITSDEVDAVDVLVHPAATHHPAWLLDSPTDYLSTQLSHPWAVAMTVLGVSPERWQQPDVIGDPRAQDIARRVRVGEDPDARRAYYDQTNPTVPGVRRVRRSPSTVVVHARGRTFEGHSDLADGDPFSDETAATDAQLRDKLVRFGSLAVPDDRLQVAAERCFALEDEAEVGPVVELLCAPDGA